MSTKKIIIGRLSVMLLFATQMVIYSFFQSQTSLNNGRGDDGVIYGAVADQILNGQPIRGAAPFVYRIGASWISAEYARFRGVTVDHAFRVTDSILMGLILTVLYFFAIRFSNPVFATIAISLFSLPWWGYTRYIWFYPILSDLPWFFLMLVGLYLVVWWPKKYPEMWRVAAFGRLLSIRTALS